MPVDVQKLNQSIVGTPKALVPQATTDASVAYAGDIVGGLMHLFVSDKSVHLKFAPKDSSPTATTNDCYLPANQFLPITPDKDVDLAIIRGADETSNGKLWVSVMLETAAKL